MWLDLHKQNKIYFYLFITKLPDEGALHCQVEHHVRDQKNLFFLSCITKMGQNFINFFSWVDIHGIYYIVKIGN